MTSAAQPRATGAVKVHVDTDLGGDIDDLCALALLLNWPGVEIAGITTVAEHDGKRAGYVRHAVALAGRPGIPVAAGADARLGRFDLDVDLPPEERYWPEPVAPCPGPLDAALDLLERSIDQGATIIGIGPFTNLALLEQRQPGILAGAKVCLMGGCLRPAPPGFSAWDYRRDYNVQADRAAARHVLERCTPTLVPIEVTIQTALRRTALPAVQRSGPLGRLLAHQAAVFAEYSRREERYAATRARLPPEVINFQHDPLTCAVALGWDGVTIETLPLTFETPDGWLRLRGDPHGRPLRVVTGVDADAFDALWVHVVTRETA